MLLYQKFQSFQDQNLLQDFSISWSLSWFLTWSLTAHGHAQVQKVPIISGLEDNLDTKSRNAKNVHRGARRGAEFQQRVVCSQVRSNYPKLFS